MIYLPFAAALALGVLAGVVLLARARAARRWSAALDDYAEQEIARSQIVPSAVRPRRDPRRGARRSLPR
jgi:hypothetical protein